MWQIYSVYQPSENGLDSAKTDCTGIKICDSLLNEFVIQISLFLEHVENVEIVLEVGFQHPQQLFGDNSKLNENLVENVKSSILLSETLLVGQSSTCVQLSEYQSTHPEFLMITIILSNGGGWGWRWMTRRITCLTSRKEHEGMIRRLPENTEVSWLA